MMEVSFIQELPTGLSVALNEQVWKILVDDTVPLLVIQTRNGEAYQTSFTAVDIHQNQVLWQNFTLEESWWLGMAELHAGVLLLYTYPDTQKPQSQGIIAVDVATQQILWQTQKANFSQIIQGQVLTISFEQSTKVYQLLDLKTGEVLEQFREFESLDVLKNENNKAIFPFHYYNEMAYFQTVAIFLKKKFNLQIVQAVDYLEYENFIIISYFHQSTQGLANNLLVLNHQNQVLLHQNIAQQLTGIGLDTFFVFEKQVFFVKHKTHLMSLKL
ncbi:DUF4905 domain-containing protein [uncultured Microscilla sp.]|uniref:DUF4905 domain-containing protein n=1 Tax=uncultured Microscilla sp. TaxID=432653 RepID=UPI002635453A|nr:DUF4905 domain-containing protein [uncultured Microscilla sp.]